MAWFDPRAYGRAPSSRRGKLLVLGTSTAILVGLSVLVTGGFAQSSDDSTRAVAAAKKRGFVPVCVQRQDVKHSQGDLNVLLARMRQGAEATQARAVAREAQGRKARRSGTRRTAGRARSARTAGPQGAAGAAAAAPEFGVGTVFVERGNNGPSRFAAFSVPLGSPAGSTTGGELPLLVFGRASTLQDLAGSRRHLQPNRHRGVLPEARGSQGGQPGALPMTFCEYADGATNNLGIDQVQRVPTLGAAVAAMQTQRNLGIGGTLDCGATGQTNPGRGS